MTDDFSERAMTAALASTRYPVTGDVGQLQAEVLKLRFYLGVISQGIPCRGESDPRKIAAAALNQKETP